MKRIALDLHAKAEDDFLTRLRSRTVAIYVGNSNRHLNAHLADFPGLLEADALIFVELHRARDVVERTISNLPQFNHLPVIITHASYRPFIGFERFIETVTCLQLRLDEARPRKLLEKMATPYSWGLMIELNLQQGNTERDLPILLLSSCSALYVFAYLAKKSVAVSQVIEPEVVEE